MIRKLIIYSAIVLLSNGSFACDQDGKSGLLPENSMRIPIESSFRNSITKDDVDHIFARVKRVYKPIVKEHKHRLRLINKWKDDVVNARASQTRWSYKVTVFGGLARHPLMNIDALYLAVCHEMGHHLGGAPRKGVSAKYWASSEGQADYWATMKCMRRLLLEDNNIDIVANMQVDNEVRQKCTKVFADSNEAALCIRSSMASLNLAKLLAREGEVVNFSTPDPSVVVRTYTSHPEAQCRLDTYFQGALCERDYRENVDFNDATIGVCLRADSLVLGPRPLCWYHP